MNKLDFLKPSIALEEGGRESVPVMESSEPEKNCPNCHKDIPLSKLWANQLVCACGHHFRLSARERIHILVDADSFHELFDGLKSHNPLDFPGYDEKLAKAHKVTSEEEAVLCGTAEINQQKCCLFVMDSNFMMGSMGSIVGEKITCLFAYAQKHRLPVIGFTVSGGARMQEGLLSLMQMAKTSCAVKQHSDAGLLYVVVLTDPTTGGVTASFAMQADIILAEPGATIGFAGARVIEQTTKKTLTKEFQKAEFNLKHGFVDAIVNRLSQKEVLTEILRIHNGG